MNQKTSSTTLSIIIILAVVIFAGVLISKNKPADYNNTVMNEQKSMKITSNVFENNGTIPVAYTCNGTEMQPPLVVQDVPKDAKSLALIVFDPDAPNGGFIHWVVWGINPKISVIENGNSASATEGYTGLGKPGWVAPCPPTGIHHYNFSLYALDTALSIPLSSTRTDLLTAMQGHIIDQAVLIGLYGK